MAKTLNASEQLTARKKLGLPEHFCRAGVCAHATAPLPNDSLLTTARRYYLRVIGEFARVWKVEVRKGVAIISDGGANSKTADFKISMECLLHEAQKPARFVTITLTGGRKVTVQTEDIRSFLRAHPAGK